MAKELFDEKEKALDYIENIISSMRECSFKCKEFCILICSAFLTIFATVNPTPKLMVILCVPVLLIFWIIDSAYLSKERSFRKKYNDVVLNKFIESNCSPLMFKKEVAFWTKIGSFFKAMFGSFSTVLLYFPLILLAVVFGTLILNGCL